jgi:F-type H+-transporting ATPase subunit gamma
MASLRLIRRRIRSIQSTKQVMRAMQLVSASKFKRAQGRLLQGRQVLSFLDGLLQRVLTAAPTMDHPLTARRDDAPSALVMVTSDTGLAGSYNANVIQLAESELRKDTARRTEIVFIGKRGHRYFAARGYQSRQAHLDMAGRPDIQKIDAIGYRLMEQFLAGGLSSVRVLYATFISTTVSRPTVKQWLPVQFSNQQSAISNQQEYIFEPSAKRVFEELLPRWAIATFRLAVLEAFTSEHGARMIAMKNATDNAQELLDALTLQRNTLRQATITKELSEIVGTVEALR